MGVGVGTTRGGAGVACGVLAHEVTRARASAAPIETHFLLKLMPFSVPR